MFCTMRYRLNVLTTEQETLQGSAAVLETQTQHSVLFAVVPLLKTPREHVIPLALLIKFHLRMCACARSYARRHRREQKYARTRARACVHARAYVRASGEMSDQTADFQAKRVRGIRAGFWLYNERYRMHA